MPHISSKKLSPKLTEKLFGKLIAVLGKAQNQQSLPLITNELFTATEKIMLAKRLAIILLLVKNIPQHRIVETLNVSPSTVAKTSLMIEIGKYNAILKISQKEKLDIEKLVWNILTAGGIMPPKVGRKYWRKYKKF
jgi:Trp operon repressor